MVKILPDATFSGIPLTASLSRKRIHSEYLYENHFFYLVALMFSCKYYSRF